MDKFVEHEEAHRNLIKDQLKRSSNVGAVTPAVVAAGANPTKAEFDAVVAKLNSALTVMRDAGLIPAA